MANFDRFTRLFTRNLQREIDRTFNNGYLGEVGEQIIDFILRRTRSGFGVDRSGGRQQRLRPLSPDYVEHRREFQGLASTTSPRRSNLTYTGFMLESLRRRVLPGRRLVVEFSNSVADDRAAEVSVRRPFLHLTGGDIRRLTREFRQRLARNLGRVRV